MSYATIDFDAGVPYVSRLPMGLVTLINPGGAVQPWRTLALVDTGADYLQLPISAANMVGIDYQSGVSTAVTGIGTSPVGMWLLNVDVEIASLSQFPSVRVAVPVLFGDRAKPLLGRQALFAVLNHVGFSNWEWMLDW